MKKSNLLRKRHKQLLLVALMVLLPILMTSRSSIAGNLESSVKNPDTLVYATIALPYTLDPAVSWDSLGWMAISNCYDTLITLDGEEVDRFVPQIAIEIPTLENGGISTDSLTYRFHIREGVKFHDGSLLTPEDVEYSIERVMVYDQGASMFLSAFLTGYSSESVTESVEVEGNDVLFHLLSPYAPFMQVLRTPIASIVSKQWCIEHGEWPGTTETIQEYRELGPSALDTATMGAGPFTLESWTDDEVVLVRSDYYWAESAKLKRVKIKSVPDWEERKQMFLAGDIDIVVGVPADSRAELDGAEGVRVYTGLSSMVVSTARPNRAISPYSGFIGSGTLDGDGIPLDFFADLDVRKAFAYAFDYQGIIDEHWGGEATQPATIIIEGLPFHNPDQEKYSLDLNQAKLHFQQAMGGQVWQNGFTFTIPYNTGNDVRKEIAESIETHIEAINPGIFHIDVVGVSWGEFLFGSLFGENPLAILGWAGDYPDPDNFVTPFMETDSFFYWISGYSDPYVDDLIQQGRFELDPTARRAIYYELQQIYHDDVVGIPLAQPLGRHYERDWVQGWYYNPAASIDFYSIWKEDDNLVNMLITHVEELVDDGILKQGAGNSLIKKLESVIHLIDQGNLQGASQKMNDFIDQVEALIRSERLPVEEGQELIALAQEIIESIGVT